MVKEGVEAVVARAVRAEIRLVERLKRVAIVDRGGASDAIENIRRYGGRSHARPAHETTVRGWNGCRALPADRGYRRGVRVRKRDSCVSSRIAKAGVGIDLVVHVVGHTD